MSILFNMIVNRIIEVTGFIDPGFGFDNVIDPGFSRPTYPYFPVRPKYYPDCNDCKWKYMNKLSRDLFRNPCGDCEFLPICDARLEFPTCNTASNMPVERYGFCIGDVDIPCKHYSFRYSKHNRNFRHHKEFTIVCHKKLCGKTSYEFLAGYDIFINVGWRLPNNTYYYPAYMKVDACPISSDMIMISFPGRCLEKYCFDLIGYVAVSKPFNQCKDIRFMAAYSKCGNRFIPFTY
ncbi:hypothetical protein HERIO_484 [Hepatospora eriocheir]|uniref:Uncharacterized protein n=1 Tax=Hepatospora eriocheir TaxID=1081669 RepID=A0A1X0QCZ5_9MICR|nr:hypothetical protein HERIO_484 [Hepatospora eriocheir]